MNHMDYNHPMIHLFMNEKISVVQYYRLAGPVENPQLVEFVVSPSLSLPLSLPPS